MAKKSSGKTNAMRMLDAASIVYGMAEYEVDESDLSGVHAAEELGVPAETVFKTLVARGDGNELFVFIIPVAENLDLKKAAASSGNKRIEMIHVRELFDLTGYVRGGCSPIGMKKAFPTFLHESAEGLEHIYVSAGRVGCQIELDPRDLAEVVGCEFIDII